MSYWDTANLSDDPDFRARCTAALATEGHPAPEQQAYAWRWQYAGQPGFGEAYAYAVETGVPNPGRDPAVITDAQILSATQLLLAGGGGGGGGGAPTLEARISEVANELATLRECIADILDPDGN